MNPKPPPFPLLLAGELLLLGVEELATDGDRLCGWWLVVVVDGLEPPAASSMVSVERSKSVSIKRAT